MSKKTPQAFDGNHKKIDPRLCVLPVLKEIAPGQLSIVGTGFYVTRYGLFVSARHVLDTLVTSSSSSLGVGYVCHQLGAEAVCLRRIRHVALFNNADIAVGQADNFMDRVPEQPLSNMRARLGAQPPERGTRVITYAYPENNILDFTDANSTPEVCSDFYEGTFTRTVVNYENPSLPYPYFETSIPSRCGASGGPVFDGSGRVIGIICRGWDFGDDDDGEPLSYIVPVRAMLDMRLSLVQLPENSWERMQIPDNRVATNFSIAELAAYGHLDFDLRFS